MIGPLTEARSHPTVLLNDGLIGSYGFGAGARSSFGSTSLSDTDQCLLHLSQWYFVQNWAIRIGVIRGEQQKGHI